LSQVFTEEQTYRIDHYLGKEVIQNLMVLRFANLVFEPIWNRRFIREVRIDWQEDIGVAGRGGYFDRYGIVRDVVQNHLLQVVALVAMEPPHDADARTVRDEKVKVLQSIPPLTLEAVTLGQYAAGEVKGQPQPGYREDPTVPDDSMTPTYASVCLRIENDRWQGVPFVVRAGKGMASRFSEVRIIFRDREQSPFCAAPGCVPSNELVIRIQPDEAIYLRIVNKEPGLDLSLVPTDLNLRYQAAFTGEIPDAYECLLLDVMNGDKSLFIRADELAAAWDVFTPVLKEIESTGVKPILYPFGGEALP
jgi:glucose-6-phosphate 1-dehydrogenase